MLCRQRKASGFAGEARPGLEGKMASLSRLWERSRAHSGVQGGPVSLSFFGSPYEAPLNSLPIQLVGLLAGCLQPKTNVLSASTPTLFVARIGVPSVHRRYIVALPQLHPLILPSGSSHLAKSPSNSDNHSR